MYDIQTSVVCTHNARHWYDTRLAQRARRRAGQASGAADMPRLASSMRHDLPATVGGRGRSVKVGHAPMLPRSGMCISLYFIACRLRAREQHSHYRRAMLDDTAEHWSISRLTRRDAC